MEGKVLVVFFYCTDVLRGVDRYLGSINWFCDGGFFLAFVPIDVAQKETEFFFWAYNTFRSETVPWGVSL